MDIFGRKLQSNIDTLALKLASKSKAHIVSALELAEKEKNEYAALECGIALGIVVALADMATLFKDEKNINALNNLSNEVRSMIELLQQSSAEETP